MKHGKKFSRGYGAFISIALFFVLIYFFEGFGQFILVTINKMITADIIAIAGLTFAVLLAWNQLRISNIQARAQIVIDLFAQHISDPEGLDMLYQIEHKKWKFNKDSFPHSIEERSLDKLLYTFGQIATLFEMGTITRDDLTLIEYDFLRVYNDEEVKKYFSFLDNTPHNVPTDEGDFSSYRRVARSLCEAYLKKRN